MDARRSAVDIGEERRSGAARAGRRSSSRGIDHEGSILRDLEGGQAGEQAGERAGQQCGSRALRGGGGRGGTGGIPNGRPVDWPFRINPERGVLSGYLEPAAVGGSTGRLLPGRRCGSAGGAGGDCCESNTARLPAAPQMPFHKIAAHRIACTSPPPAALPAAHC